MDKNIELEIQNIVANIINKIHAEKIILFGSYAYGSPKENSDIDICIITEEDKRKIEIMREIRKSLLNEITHPLDILVYKQNEFNERSEYFGSIERLIKEKGVALYG